MGRPFLIFCEILKKQVVLLKILLKIDGIFVVSGWTQVLLPIPFTLQEPQLSFFGFCSEICRNQISATLDYPEMTDVVA